VVFREFVSIRFEYIKLEPTLAFLVYFLSISYSFVRTLREIIMSNVPFFICFKIDHYIKLKDKFGWPLSIQKKVFKRKFCHRFMVRYVSALAIYKM
jgi:hypothetical protein